MSEVDLIHIGLHKTASTWLQLYGFHSHPSIKLVNDEPSGMMARFVKYFVEVPSFNFDRSMFKSEFLDKLNEVYGPKTTTQKWIISEENLSGHFWNGAQGETLLDRITKNFPKAKILVVIRRQEDMLASLYSNYIRQGGSKSLSVLLSDGNLWGSQIVQKLCYDKILQAYALAFKKENVLVLTYEEFVCDPQSFMNKIASFVGAEPFPSIHQLARKKVNVRLTHVSGFLLNFLNAFSSLGQKPGFRRLPILLDPLIYRIRKTPGSSIPKTLDPEANLTWAKSNREVEKLFGIDLKRYGYL